MPNESLTVAGVSHWFDEEGRKRLAVLKDISFSVGAHELVAVVGPSGGGKSTLLRIIAGLIQPTQGTIALHTNKLAMVFQNFAIFPWLTVRENIAFGLKMRGEGARERIVQEKISEVGLTGFAEHYPKELSGGMRQRVGIARALAVSPEVLLLDEPFSSLDSFTAQALRADLLVLWQKYQMTIIMVTQLVEEALQLADRVIVLTKRPGTVKMVCPVTLARPRDRRGVDFYALADKITAQIEQ